MKNNKKLKYSINSSVIIVGAVIVAVLLNMILVAFDSKIPLKINFIRDEIYQLTEESKEIVDKIDSETEIVILYDGNETESMKLLKNIVKKYTERNDKISIKTLNFINNLMELSSYSEAIKSISNPNYAMIFVQDEKYEVAEASSYISVNEKSVIERVVTNKLATFVDGFKISSIILTEGHGEKASVGFTSVLEMYNYKADTINLLKEDLPEDIKSLLVVNAPVSDFSKEEIDKIDEYLEKGGNVQIYFDPIVSNDEFKNLEGYLNDKWYIKRNHGVIVDMPNKLNSADESSALYGILSIAEFTDNEVVSPIKSSKRDILYSASNPIEITADKSTMVKTEPVLTTSDNAYLKTLDTLSESQTADDAKGEFNIIVSSSRDTYSITGDRIAGKLLVSGSSYTMDTLIGDARYANEDLLINSINWMRGSEAGVTVREKDLPEGTLTVPVSHFWPWFIALAIVLPVGIFIAGFVIWAKRRYK